MAPGSQRMVALLRGINVGKAKRVAMADLRAMVADLGYDDVATLLSGNVVFTGSGTSHAAARIAAGLAGTLGVTANVMVVKENELAEIMVENPLAQVATDPARLLVVFCARRADWRGWRRSRRTGPPRPWPSARALLIYGAWAASWRAGWRRRPAGRWGTARPRATGRRS